MKKYYITFLIINIFGCAIAQSYTQSFNEVFQNVDLSNASTGIIYERVLPFSNLIKHTTNQQGLMDTSSFEQFIMAYDELYRAGAQNTFLSEPVEEMLMLLPGNEGTVVLGSLHTNFNIFDTAAMRQRLFFDEDSVLWENTSVNVSLFNEITSFMTAPLVESIEATSVIFSIDPNFFFDNTSNPVISMKIDFGDGYGERTVALGSEVNVDYSSEGNKIIRIVATFSNNDTVVSYSSLKVGTAVTESLRTNHHYVANFTINGQIIPPYPYSDGGSFNTSIGAMRIYFSNADMMLRKPILIVDGFDPENKRSFENNIDSTEKSIMEMLENGIDFNMGDSLVSLGYDLVLLDFPEGGTYIEQNAMVCIAAINKINELLQQSQSSEQIVIVGPSMGGQITRYALAYMEHNPNVYTNFGNHNCRLWVSFDSPHQGANISMGAQAMVDYFRIKIVNYENDASILWNNTLCCVAAQQMLIHHKKTGAATYFNTYYNQINNMGYPLSLRKIGISNGSLNNTPNGQAHQIAMELVVATHLLLPYTLDVRVRNMVNQGSGEVFSATHWIGFIPIHITWTYPNNNNRGSIDVAPGCQYNTFDKVTNTLSDMLKLLKIFNIPTNQHSHCFMPVTSVLDYSDVVPYATNFSNLDLVAAGKIPFDSYWGPLGKNMEHISFDDNLVNYLINEVETYIQGPREVQLCSRPTYTLHLPQDSVATVTWQSSDNIRLITGNNPYEVTIVPLSTVDGWVSAEVSTLKHRKQLAHYPIHVFQDDFPLIDTVSNATDTLYVNTTMLLGDTFCVNCGKTVIVTDTLHCAPSARLIVRPGGKLIVDGGTLTSACTEEMWQGIFVEGHSNLHQTEANQGKVVLRNGAVIENALCGIRTGAPGDTGNTSTGGIIRCFNSVFRNCAKAVAFLPYADTIGGTTIRNNFSGFTNCTFTVDDNNLFADNNTSFDTHVSLWDVRGVSFEGCTFNNATTAMTYDRGYAIKAEDAGFSISTLCDTVYTEPSADCQCPAGKATYSQFGGFLTAISANTTGNTYYVSVDEARFSNNGTGVSFSGNGHVAVTRNDFNMNSLPGTLMEGTGLSLNGCTGYLVEENNFRRRVLSGIFPFVGISVENSGTAANSLYRNSFLRLNKAVQVTGTNGGYHNTVGLECACNTFSGDQYDIYVSAYSDMAQQQGSASVGADNSFTGTTASSFHNAGYRTMDYYHIPGGNRQPYTPTSNVNVRKSLAANPCLSTLCDDGSHSPLPPDPIKSPDAGYLLLKAQYDTLLSVFGSRGYADIVANPSEDLYTPSDIQSARLCLAQLGELERELHARSSTAVRSLLRDTLLDLPAVESWFAATPGLSGQYSLAETEYLAGESNALTLQGVAALLTTPEERDEYDNYMAFNALKEALSGHLHGHANWPLATEGQIAELQRIADAGTGRSSVMARGVLCFFFGICYDDEDFTPTGDIRRLASTGEAGDPSHNSDVSMKLYPNPAGNTLHVEFEGTDDLQGTITVTNITGVVVLTRECHERVTQLDVSNLSPGLYVVSFRNEKGVVVKKFVKM